MQQEFEQEPQIIPLKVFRNTFFRRMSEDLHKKPIRTVKFLEGPSIIYYDQEQPPTYFYDDLITLTLEMGKNFRQGTRKKTKSILKSQ
ncbi:hypothetical protein pb186bvf_012660 [Paramecium bursaria]